MSVITFRHINWASQECFWQRSGEMSVAWMMDGFLYAHRHRNRTVQLGDILKLGGLVEPRKNNGVSFRSHNVAVGWESKLPWQEVDDAIERLVKNTPSLSEFDEEMASDWFRQYEDIHPFGDGNGRTGSILYNWLRGSLPKPIHPPNLWDDPMRSYKQYPEPIM